MSADQETHKARSDFDEEKKLKCFDCDVIFEKINVFHDHLLGHVKLPHILVNRLAASELPSPPLTPDGTLLANTDPKTPQEQTLADLEAEESHQDSGVGSAQSIDVNDYEEVLKMFSLAGDTPAAECDGDVAFSPNFVEEVLDNENSNEPHVQEPDDTGNGIPGAEPTPPPEPSPDLPKIRIKSGLLKESLTITEITDDNNTQINGKGSSPNGNRLHSPIWNTPSLEDALKLPDSTEKDDSSLISTLFNNIDRAKDLGFTSSDEFISIDRLEEHAQSRALQVYNSSANSMGFNSSNPLDSLAGLPMQQLAEQVSRLKPGNGPGMQQQNVLINIQQFPQAPPHAYQPPPMFHPPHPGMPQQPPMYPPYNYPQPSVYFSGPGYGSHMPPPRPQMPPQQPMSQQMGQPMGQSMPQMQPQQPQYRQPVMQRQPAPRGTVPNAPRGSMMPRNIAPRQPPPLAPQRQQTATRMRQPMMRPRAPAPVHMPMRAPRPRGPAPQNSTMQARQPQDGIQGPRMVKRTQEQLQALQAKRKRMDVFVPDKHDDPDCEVIAVQPKNTGLPQIQSIQGGAKESNSSNSNSSSNSSILDNSIMHLSDSITLSVRNPPPKPASPKKSDAKDVADILATRGITVTPAPKKDKPEQQKSGEITVNLNSSVSLSSATSKQSNNTKSSTSSSETRLPTVDLTEDSGVEATPVVVNKPGPPPPPLVKTNQSRNLPFRCDLCTAQYPNQISLTKHRQTFHRVGSPPEYGVPLINLKQPGLVSKLRSIGIMNYIPIGGSNEGNFALPIVNVNNMNKYNLTAMGATSVLTLGPVRTIPQQQKTQQQQQN